MVLALKERHNAPVLLLYLIVGGSESVAVIEGFPFSVLICGDAGFRTEPYFPGRFNFDGINPVVDQSALCVFNGKTLPVFSQSGIPSYPVYPAPGCKPERVFIEFDIVHKCIVQPLRGIVMVPLFAVKVAESATISSYPRPVFSIHTDCKNPIAEQMVLIVIDLIVLVGTSVITDDSLSGSYPQVPALRG